MKKKVLLIVGPTAVGKTAISCEIAKHLPIEIVSADSRQVYRFMNIGTAKPTEEERAAVPHHFIDIKDPNEWYSAGQFGTDARVCIGEILQKSKLPQVVGGSGLYIRALVDGLFEPKISDASVKQKLKKRVREDGLEALYQELKNVDPVTAGSLSITDTQRILRALEVFEITGKPFSEFRQKKTPSAEFQAFFVGLTMNRDQLYAQIETRVDQMLQQGLVEEVKALKKRGFTSDLNALQTVGYKEVFLYLDNKISREEMVRLIKQKSRNYAKRQWTWFNKDKRIYWINLSEIVDKSEVATIILKQLNSD